jgi:hypothetical protein
MRRGRCGAWTVATAAQVAEFRAANQSLVTLALRDLRDFWAALNLDGEATRVRDALLDFFPELITVYGDTAALLGADWYDMLRDVPVSSASFRAALATPPQVEQAQAAARWALGPLFQAEPDPVNALSLLGGAAQRLVLKAGRDTVWDSARRDPVRTGIARVPTGPQTCSFCIMLASRGAVYASRESAGAENKYHDDCDCVPTIVRSEDDYPEGHDLDLYRRLYREGAGVGRDAPPE